MNAPTPYDSTINPLESARRLAPQIRAAAGDTEAARELPKPIFEAIADAGLFHMCVPRALGGLEVDFPQQVLIAEELGKADASTAWAVNQGATFASWSMYMQPAVVREIWIDTPRSVVSNTPEPTGKAVVVPGGYRVSGRHGFSTGCMHASWVASQAQIIDNGVVRQRNGAPELRFMFVPKTDVQVLDTWKTRGMRGTGTHHFEVNDVFVPEQRSVYTRGAPRVTDGTRYRIPTTLIFLGGDAAVGLAVARSCVDAFCELAGGKSPRHMTGLLRDQPVAQYNVGQCEALLRSARAFLMEAVADIWDGVSRSGELTLQQRATMRLAGTHAIRTAVKVVQSIYADCGATAIFEGNPMHRLFQDIHVITQHLQSRRGFYEMIGKFQMGLPIDEARL